MTHFTNSNNVETVAGHPGHSLGFGQIDFLEFPPIKPDTWHVEVMQLGVLLVGTFDTGFGPVRNSRSNTHSYILSPSDRRELVGSIIDRTAAN